MSCTTERSSPTSRLNSVDLPTFGRPTIATENGRGPAGSGSGSGAAGGSTADQRVEEIATPPPVDGGDRVGITETELGEGPDLELAPVVVGLVGHEQHRRVGALEDASDLRVLLGRADGHVDHVHHDVGLTDRAFGLEAHLLRERLVGGDPPAGVDEHERSPVPVPTSSLRSRVTPGSSWTIASRRPTMRLTSVDLPTFGRPTTATTGFGPSACGHQAAAAAGRSAATSDAPSVRTTSTGRGRSDTPRAVEEAVLGQDDVGQQHAGVGGNGGEPAGRPRRS